MKDEAPAKRVGGGGCHSRSPAHSAAITVPAAASPAGRRHPPRRHGGAQRSLRARRPTLTCRRAETQRSLDYTGAEGRDGGEKDGLARDRETTVPLSTLLSSQHTLRAPLSTAAAKPPSESSGKVRVRQAQRARFSAIATGRGKPSLKTLRVLPCSLSLRDSEHAEFGSDILIVFQDRVFNESTFL
ncbi:hypothetical protein HJG60_007942 [Phyllostomus discolor]|uniref:Uncharacterized protein n=1 Tax=Phyllostomus discolor TaxID=89673 RepID=A0A834BHR4_9CHIR|nr:hypothetical protein HJG60_007942 [Phyllostomus discolor]